LGKESFDDEPQLIAWKKGTERKHAEYINREYQKQESKRHEELVELSIYQDFIREKSNKLDRYHLQRHHIAEEFEQNRLHLHTSISKTRMTRKTISRISCQRKMVYGI